MSSFRSFPSPGGGAPPAVPAEDLAWISVTQIREVDRLAIEYGLTLARIRGPVSGGFAWSADDPMPLLLPSGSAGARAVDVDAASSRGA